MKCDKCGGEISKQRFRTLDQNKKLHAVFSEIANITGYSPEEIKALMKIQFGKYKDCINKKTGETFIIYDSTAKMNVTELSEFLENVLIFANSKFNLNL